MNNAEQWTSARFFERLDFFLKDRDWKLTDLGTATDITTQSLYAMRKRHTLPSLTSLCTICDALEISLTDFFNISPEGNPEVIAITQCAKEMPAEARAALCILVRRIK